MRPALPCPLATYDHPSLINVLQPRKTKCRLLRLINCLSAGISAMIYIPGPSAHAPIIAAHAEFNHYPMGNEIPGRELDAGCGYFFFVGLVESVSSICFHIAGLPVHMALGGVPMNGTRWDSDTAVASAARFKARPT